MSHYQHLTISERESIWENKLAGKSLREIARQTGRSVSTISRELKRNGTSQKYRPSEAQKKYERRRKRCRRKKLLQEGELKDLVVRLLTQQQWSPEQIAQRIELERGKKLVSYATIYRALHKGLMESKGTRKNRHGRYPMEKHLRRKGWRGKGKGQKSRHFVHQTIEERPEEANRRSEIGHWEGDLVYSSFYKLYVVTLVDRKSRFLLTGISYSRKAQEVSDVICRLLKKLPEKHVRSLTLDRGSEFSEHGQITKAFPSLQISYGDKPLFTGLDAEIPAGKITAIVGPSGSGKTTLLNLIDRLYPLAKGTIAVDGQDIAGISLHSFRQAVGYVTQESVMYSGTIRQNLLYGLDRTPDDRELDRVCEAVGILDFVQEQPEGYDTPVGEAGASLSGGQRQRFSVARALLQKSDILLLDEATAAMDIAGKDCVWKSIRTLMAGKTVVYVAHDAQTLQNADWILVLEHGTVTAAGDRQTVLQQSAFCREMMDLKGGASA